MCASSREGSFRIVLVSGFDQSGKSSVAGILKGVGYRTIECGELARRILCTTRGARLTDLYQRNIKNVDAKIRKIVVEEAGPTCSTDRFCVVGVRSIGLFTSLVEDFCNEVETVFVDSNFEIRFSRHCQDSRVQDHLSKSDFAANDAAQVGWGLLNIRDACGRRICNNGDLEVLKNSVELIVGSK